MTICYRYLDEEELACETFGRCRKSVIPDFVDAAMMGITKELIVYGLACINPLTWIDRERRRFYSFDFEEVEKAVFALPPKSLPPHLPLR